MNGLELKGIFFKAGEFTVDIDSLIVPDKDYFILMGHTGSGKSLLLKTIAGLIRPSRGTVQIRGRDITEREPRLRNIGYVPQDSGLFPHLDVRRNLEFPLRLKGMVKDEIQVSVRSMSEDLQIDHLLGRNPANLSGGERQKAALARALLCRPEVLLLDEPVSALDGRSKGEVLDVLRKIHEEFAVTAIHVCHNTEEARNMGDTMALIAGGRIADSGSTGEVLERTRTENPQEDHDE